MHRKVTSKRFTCGNIPAVPSGPEGPNSRSTSEHQQQLQHEWGQHNISNSSSITQLQPIRLTWITVTVIRQITDNRTSVLSLAKLWCCFKAETCLCELSTFPDVDMREFIWSTRIRWIIKKQHYHVRQGEAFKATINKRITTQQQRSSGIRVLIWWCSTTNLVKTNPSELCWNDNIWKWKCSMCVCGSAWVYVCAYVQPSAASWTPHGCRRPGCWQWAPPSVQRRTTVPLWCLDWCSFSRVYEHIWSRPTPADHHNHYNITWCEASQQGKKHECLKRDSTRRFSSLMKPTVIKEGHHHYGFPLFSIFKP